MTRMTLDNLVVGRQQRPVRISLYGVDGIGKSTMGADAPAPIFLAPEDGTAHLDTTRFPQPQTWHDVMAAIGLLYDEDHDFKTLVLDSADWAENLALEDVCREANVGSIEDLGYGKGYVRMRERFTRLLAAFDALYSQGMNVIVISHSTVMKFQDPEREPYDRYTLKLDKENAAKLREWCDYNLFCNFDTTMVTVGKDKQHGPTRAKSFGKREIHTVRTAAYDAKRRYNIPDRLPLSWESFYSAHQAASGITQPNPTDEVVNQ